MTIAAAWFAEFSENREVSAIEFSRFTTDFCVKRAKAEIKFHCFRRLSKSNTLLL